MKSLIGNEWRNSSNGKTIDVINPVTNELIDTIPELTDEDVNEAVEYAYNIQPEWAKIPLVERCNRIKRFVELIRENAEELSQLISVESGKPITVARSEIRNIQVGVPAYIEKIKHSYGDAIPQGSESGKDKTFQIVVREPIGVVAALTPFNFPSNIFIHKVPTALMLGNAVILKPASVNPLTISKYVEYLLEAGVPAGAIQLVHGSGSKVGSALARNSKVSMVSLTGSTVAGIDVARNCAGHVGKTTLELGGNDAFIVCEDADVDLAVAEAVGGRMYNSGQICCSSKRFVVHESVLTEFTEKVVQKVESLKVGDISDESTEIGTLISESAAIEVETQVKKTIDQGAKLLCGGYRNGAFYAPTVLSDVTRDMDIASDMEVFGPVMPIISYRDVDEAVDIANNTAYGLGNAIMTKDYHKAFNISRRLNSGGVVINGSSYFRSFEMPFGGWNLSGLGTEGVSTVIEELTRPKTIVLKNVFEE